MESPNGRGLSRNEANRSGRPQRCYRGEWDGYNPPVESNGNVVRSDEALGVGLKEDEPHHYSCRCCDLKKVKCGDSPLRKFFAAYHAEMDLIAIRPLLALGKGISDTIETGKRFLVGWGNPPSTSIHAIAMLIAPVPSNCTTFSVFLRNTSRQPEPRPLPPIVYSSVSIGPDI